MKSNKAFLAIFVLSLMILPANANAFWLDVVKSAAKGLVSLVADAPKGTPSDKMQASNQTQATNSTAAVELTEKELVAAFDSLARHCREFSRQGLPCGMHTAKSTLSLGNALEIANTRADGELARSVKQFVSTKTTDILAQMEDDEGNSSESTEFKRTLEIVVNQELSVAQTYLTYSRVAKNAKGKDVYEVWVVRVLDVNIFERALAESSQGKSIGKFIGEIAKNFASKIKKKN